MAACPSQGIYVIEAKPTASPANVDEDYCQACKTSARLLVQACSQDDEFVVVDLDYTLVADNMFKVITQDETRMLQDSSDVMCEIANRYYVIYLTHRPDQLARKSKQFLEGHGFPQGVLVMCPWNESLHQKSSQDQVRPTLRG